MNTAIIMDMMFNTEMIVKDMKGGKEDMTEKQFTYIKLGDRDEIQDYIINNNHTAGHFKYKEYHFNNISDFEDLFDLLNELSTENEQLKKRLKLSNDNVEILQYENEQLRKSNKDAWDLIRFIYNEIKEDGSMDFGRIKDLVEFDGDVE